MMSFIDKLVKQLWVPFLPQTYTTLTMGYFEVHFYDICELKWGKEFKEFILENWGRFLDDRQTPLDKNTIKPEQLLGTFYSVNEAIEFTMEFSDKEIPFLDKTRQQRDIDGFVSQTYGYTTMSSILHQSSKTLLKKYSICNG